MNTERFYKLPRDLTARRDLTGNDKVLCSIIVDRIGNNGRAWPGIRRLAADAGVSFNTVLGSLARLQDKGLLSVERRGAGRTNHYTIATGSDSRPEPLQDLKRCKTCSSGDSEPEALSTQELSQNQTDPLNQTHTTVAWDESTNTFVVEEELLARWREAYKPVDVDSEIKKAAAWYLANPVKRKKNLERFLVNWLGRADKPPPTSRTSRKAKFTRARTAKGEDYNALAEQF